MRGNEAFAVPRDRQEVTVHLDKGILVTGEIFLDYFAGDLSVHQKITSFLENKNVFFPLKINATGSTEFINKKNLGIVEVAVPDELDTEFFSLQLIHTIPVTAILVHGDTFSGTLMAEVPKEKARLSDCLNLSDNFLSVKTAGKIFYINKKAIQKVIHADNP